MFRVRAQAGTTERRRLHMSEKPDDQDAPGADDEKPDDADIDEASEESFPASDPPSYGSAEPG
jgi:hypothetical protein